MSLCVGVVTVGRSDYGLLKPLLEGIRQSKDLTLRLIVTGYHYGSEWGDTHRLIEKDGFTIDASIEMLLTANSRKGVLKSMGVAAISFSEALERLKLDAMILLGDRFETLSAATAALIFGIPLVHIHGGEISEGAFDDAMRHAMSKMSGLHMTATQRARSRLIQMGESPQHVHHVGSLGVYHAKQLTLTTRETLESYLKVNIRPQCILATVHPETMNLKSPLGPCDALLAALEEAPDLQVIFTKANADPLGTMINRKLEDFAACYPDRATVFDVLGAQNYFSLLQYVGAVVGNSSSGLIEVPSFKKPTLDIGMRQRGRERSDSVLWVDSKPSEVLEGLRRIFEPNFLKQCASVVNPYEKEDPVGAMLKALREYLQRGRFDKKFYDLEGTLDE